MKKLQKLGFIFFTTLLLLAACGSHNKDTQPVKDKDTQPVKDKETQPVKDKETQNEVVKKDELKEFIFEESTEKTMIDLTEGEVLELTPKRVYVIGTDLKQGTYKISYEASEKPSSIYIQQSTVCAIGSNEVIVNDGMSKGIFEFNYDYYFEDGTTLKILGEPEVATIEFLTDKDAGYKGLWCNK